MLISAKLTDKEFLKFSKLIYEHTGIHMKPEKKELLNARLSKRLRACKLDSFKKYYELVNLPGQKDKEFVNFLDSVSTNFTSFFREISHFEYLSLKVLPSLLTSKRDSNKEFIFWSSASSSGEEPFTMAMVLHEFASRNPGFQFRVIATDISSRVLKVAANGVYPMEQAARVPENILKKYFQKGIGNSAGKVKVKDEIRQHVEFRRFNLMHNFPWHEEVDVVFCRNVMIYFDRITQERLVKKFYDSLCFGGFLFIGHSESITSIKHDFKQVESTTYQKV